VWTIAGGATVAHLAGPHEARAEDESSIDIDIGASRRVGGRGITDEDRRAYDRARQPDEPLTEENIPPPGHPKRIEALHTLADRYVGGNMWKEACVKYDRIREEGGEEAIRSRDRGAVDAGRSYLGCAKNAYLDGDFDRAEELLRVSETFMGASGRHEALRWKMLRDEVHEKAMNGDFGGAYERFRVLQDLRESEEERIWFGEQIAGAAWRAHEDDDPVRRDALVAIGEEVAPRNVELRRLKDQMALTGTVMSNIVVYGVGAFVVVGLLTLLSRRWARSRVGGGRTPKKLRKNPFLDDEDEIA